MKQGLKKLPAPLRKQALLRFAGAGACFLLLCGMALGTGQAGLCLPFFVCRKPLARRVVPKKACADDEDRKTPFVVK